MGLKLDKTKCISFQPLQDTVMCMGLKLDITQLDLTNCFATDTNSGYQ